MIGLWSGVHITGTQGRMRGHNWGCVTSLVSLQRFCITYGRSKKKTKQQNTLSSYLCVRHLQRKGKWSRSRRKWPQDVPWLETNDKRNEMCAHVRCVRAHTGELRKISWSQRSFCQIIKRSVVELLQFDKKKRWRKNPLWNWIRFIRSDVTCGAMSGCVPNTNSWYSTE